MVNYNNNLEYVRNNISTSNIDRIIFQLIILNPINERIKRSFNIRIYGVKRYNEYARKNINFIR